MASTEERPKVLVVDDESNVRDSLRLILSRSYEVDVAADGGEALELLQRTGTASPTELPSLIIMDLMMPGIDGIGLLERIRDDYPSIPVIMLTASRGVKSAVQAMKIGAVDYLNKPFDVDELLSLIEETFENGAAGRTAPNNVAAHVQNRTNLPEVPGDFGTMVGQHPLMQELYRKLEQLAARDTTILITGESGTGKELIAREIHRRSKRASGPFVAINCAAIPESLIESELFGHEKGAFTHAVEKRLGHFELADKGTLFLDEIGELSLPIQVKMLRFLQEQEFYRVGRSKPIKVDVRILTATNRSLETAIREGNFRQDLFYRINVVSLESPPLRERSEDIPNLVEHFLNRLSTLYSNRRPQVDPSAVDLLARYPWPGNVRELENVAESLLALTTHDKITCEDLPIRIRQHGNRDLKQEVLDGNVPFEEAERAFETELIMKALQRSNYIQTKAAELLGISRRILKYKMDKLGIADRPPA
jgi:DNA-binding NtrC family response regulator